MTPESSSSPATAAAALEQEPLRRRRSDRYAGRSNTGSGSGNLTSEVGPLWQAGRLHHKCALTASRETLNNGAAELPADGYELACMTQWLLTKTSTAATVGAWSRIASGWAVRPLLGVASIAARWRPSSARPGRGTRLSWQMRRVVGGGRLGSVRRSNPSSAANAELAEHVPVLAIRWPSCQAMWFVPARTDQQIGLAQVVDIYAHEHVPEFGR